MIVILHVKYMRRQEIFESDIVILVDLDRCRGGGPYGCVVHIQYHQQEWIAGGGSAVNICAVYYHRCRAGPVLAKVLHKQGGVVEREGNIEGFGQILHTIFGRADVRIQVMEMLIHIRKARTDQILIGMDLFRHILRKRRGFYGIPGHSPG